MGTIGYLLLGFSPLNALFQTVTTVSTVGFREVEPLSANGQVFTMVLIVLGVGAAFYAFGVIIETFIEGRLNELLGRRRMDKTIASMTGHVVICGAGRVGRSICAEVAESGRRAVVIELDEDKAAACGAPAVVGDATEDAMLRAAGIERASALVAAVETDADNSFIVLSARALNPGLFVVARARSVDSEEKMRRAGADRVVMHERSIEFRLEEVRIDNGSPIVGRSLRDAHLRDRTGALVLALREPDGTFRTNPTPDAVMEAGQVIIAIGTQAELESLTSYVSGPA
jgi:voltage-gated potassium channel